MNRYFTYRWSGGMGTGDGIKILFLLNGIFFLAQHIWGGRVIWLFGLVPYRLWTSAWIWTLLSYMFLHADIFHLLFNMYTLWAFGREIESLWGFRRFLVYYLVTGVGAGLFHAMITPFSMVPTIGASGAVLGVLTAFAVLNPYRIVHLLLFFVLPIQMRARTLALFFGATSLLLGITGSPDRIAHFAHLGGMLTGYVYLKVGGWKRKFFQWSRRVRFAMRGEEEKARQMQNTINKILDKANTQGFDRLTRKEKRILKKASQLFKKTSRNPDA